MNHLSFEPTAPMIARPRSIRYAGRWQRLLLAGALIIAAVTMLRTFTVALAWHGMTEEAQTAVSAPTVPLVAVGNSISLHMFDANLAGAQEVPAVDTVATGRAVLSLISDTLYYRLFIADIDNVTAAHIHNGAAGVNGSVVFPLFTGGGSFDAENPISGTLTLTSTQIAQLVAGEYYINVHTSDAPSGEIRGQIQPYTPATNFNALLLGSGQVPAVETAAKGLAKLTLINTDTLQYMIAVSDIVSVTTSHIHIGPIGANGPVAHALYTGTGSFDPDNPISGTVTLDAQEMVDLLTNYFYVNVHTSAHSGGEIRGQVGGTRLFGAALTGATETPPVTSDASGRAILALSADATSLAYRIIVNDLSGISASHIHRGAAGVAGPVIFPLFGGGGGSFDPSHPLSGTIALTTDQVLTLIAGDYYINIHTPSVPSGALRGQLQPLAAPMHMMAPLTGAAEVPAVETVGVGIARLTLDDALGALHYSVAVTDIIGIGASHIHLGPVGQNGGVIFGLYNSSSGTTFDASHPIAGAVMPTAKQWVDLLTGYYYVNAHTSAHSGGEIRGQIGGAQLFQSQLSGTNQVPTVTTAARGLGVMALNTTATALDYRVTVAQISDVTASHIHKGAPGSNGGVVVALYTGGVGGFNPTSPVSGTVALATAQVLDLLQGNYYVNVHTAANPSGEIRGQLVPYTATLQYNVPLSGTQEVPPVATAATGNAFIRVDPTLGVLYYAISVTDVVSATAAHIHLGPVGKNGGVIFGLFNAAGGALLDASNPLGGLWMMNSKQLVDLATAYYYVNVHTVAHPSGEIRGQIGEITDEVAVDPSHQLYLPIINK